jgi:CheY-like chemotaxis protein
MFSAASNSDVATVCLLDSDPLRLVATSRSLSSAGWQVRPFTCPDAFIDYARIHQPGVAIVYYGGSGANGLQVVARLREVSSVTHVIMTLRIHSHSCRAHNLLSESELVPLIEQHCIKRSTRPAGSARPISKWRPGADCFA